MSKYISKYFQISPNTSKYLPRLQLQRLQLKQLQRLKLQPLPRRPISKYIYQFMYN